LSSFPVERIRASFTSGYRRVVLENPGHFSHREAPGLVADAVLDILTKV
jgi:pimeloyl-ACP methyl ester carboxylesterase